MGRSERQVHGDCGCSVGVDNPGVAVAGDGIVAAEAFELIEGAVVADVEGARRAVSGRVVGVGVASTLDALDRAERVGPDRGIPGHDAGGHGDGDAAGRQVDVVVAGDVKAATPVDGVVAAVSGEGVVVGVAEHRIVEHRPLDSVHAGERVGSDRSVAGGGAGGEVDGDAGGRVVEGDASVAVADDGVV